MPSGSKRPLLSPRFLAGTGFTTAPVPREIVRDALLDPGRLARAIPGAQAVEQLADGRFTARLSFGVGPFTSIYSVELVVSSPREPFDFTVCGSSQGGIGTGRAAGAVCLIELPRRRTSIAWQYGGEVGGAVALAGNTLLRTTARAFCAEFFRRLVRDLNRPSPAPPRRANAPQ